MVVTIATAFVEEIEYLPSFFFVSLILLSYRFAVGIFFKEYLNCAESMEMKDNVFFFFEKI